MSKRQASVLDNLTDSDWTEIYYALEHKLHSPAVTDRKWIKQIRHIMETIGPDGENVHSRRRR